MLKTFNFFLVVFLVMFTAAGAVLVLSGLLTLLRPVETNGVWAVSGGISIGVLSIAVVLILSLLAVGVFVISRRIRHR